MTTVKTFRFKFSEELMTEISEFSRIHRYDSKDDFKESWKLWIHDNSRLISTETEKLISMGFDGDVIKKMYISARYYFKNRNSENAEEPKKRRKYITIDKKYIRLMDDYIERAITEGDEETYKPSICFQRFIEEHQNETCELIEEILADVELNNNEIIEKLKKTFKNRYFVKTSTCAI